MNSYYRKMSLMPICLNRSYRIVWDVVCLANRYLPFLYDENDDEEGKIESSVDLSTE